MIKVSILEIVLVQVVLYCLLWIWDDYTAFLLSIVLCAILMGILIISIIAEWIEPTRVPKSYFKTMAISILAPIIITVLFLYLRDFKLPL